MDTNKHLVNIAFSAQLISTLSVPERLLIALVEDLGSVPSIHLAAHDHLKLLSQRLLSGLSRLLHKCGAYKFVNGECVLFSWLLRPK